MRRIGMLIAPAPSAISMLPVRTLEAEQPPPAGGPGEVLRDPRYVPVHSQRHYFQPCCRVSVRLACGSASPQCGRSGRPFV